MLTISQIFHSLLEITQSLTNKLYEIHCFWNISAFVHLSYPLSIMADSCRNIFSVPLPNVRSEAMGHTNVASGNAVSSLFINPATLGRINDLEINVSTSAPYYVLRESDFYFLGAAYRFHPKVGWCF